MQPLQTQPSADSLQIKISDGGIPVVTCAQCQASWRFFGYSPSLLQHSCQTTSCEALSA